MTKLELNLGNTFREPLELPFTKEEYEKMVEEERDPKNHQSHSWLDIFLYWSKHPLAGLLYLPSINWLESVEKDEDDFKCMACGTFPISARTHIVPRQFGGSNKLSNLHALCQRCHVASEGLSGYLYWVFIEHRRPIHSFLEYWNRDTKKSPSQNACSTYPNWLLGYLLTQRTDYEASHHHANGSWENKDIMQIEMSDWFIFAGEQKLEQIPFEEWKKTYDDEIKRLEEEEWGDEEE